MLSSLPRIIRFNHAFEHLTGREAESVIAQPLEILFPESERDRVLDLIRKTGLGERWEAEEIPIQKIDGEVRTVLWNSATIYEDDGESIRSIIAQGHDITDRKKADQELRENAEKLKQSNEDLERFAYVASHDLREPLRMVTSFSQLLEKNYKGKLDHDADEFIHYIVEGGTRMESLGSPTPTVSFSFGDALSSVDYHSMKAYIDDRLCISDIDGEHRRASFRNSDPLERGSHRLTIQVKDRMGNAAHIERQFVVR